MGVVPAGPIHQPGGVVGIIGHGEGAIAFPALAQAALVVSQNIEMPRQRTGEAGFGTAQVPARAADQEQGGAGALALVKEGMASQIGKRQSGPLVL